jgi:hypothetical protein
MHIQVTPDKHPTGDGPPNGTTGPAILGCTHTLERRRKEKVGNGMAVSDEGEKIWNHIPLTVSTINPRYWNNGASETLHGAPGIQ